MNTKILNKYFLEIVRYICLFKKSNVLRYNLHATECMVLKHAFEWGFTNAYTHVTTTSIKLWNFFVSWKFSSCPLSINPFQGVEKQYSDINHDSLILPILKLQQKWSHTVCMLLCLASLAKQNVFWDSTTLCVSVHLNFFYCCIILHCLNIGPYSLLQFSSVLSPHLVHDLSFHSNYFPPSCAALLHKALLSYLGSDTYYMVRVWNIEEWEGKTEGEKEWAEDMTCFFCLLWNVYVCVCILSQTVNILFSK